MIIPTFISNALAKLSRSLYPDGRAFAMPNPRGGDELLLVEDGNNNLVSEMGDNLINERSPVYNGGILFRLHRALSLSEARLYNDARSIYDSILPDNPNFSNGTIDPDDNDCNDWERRLGLIQYGVTSATTPSTAARMLAIQRKMNYPGSTAPRQSALYLQQQLQVAGFNVFVYENLTNGNPVRFIGSSGYAVCSPSVRCGLFRCGQSRANLLKIANYIEQQKDAAFSFGTNFYSTFFIGSNSLGNGTRCSLTTRCSPNTKCGVNTVFATIDAAREKELRQLILTLKPANTAGFLFINYI